MTHDIFAYMDRPNQLGLFDKKDERDIEAFFASITQAERDRHIALWNKLSCTNLNHVFQRYLFAFCSVHTTWENNIKGFSMLKNWYEWMNRPDALKDRIQLSGMGLQNNRTKYLIQFATEFWAKPEFYMKQSRESWVEGRNRIAENIFGLGKAKVSFALEMIYPETCEVFCADTHLFKAYGKDQTKDLKDYEKIERHWVMNSKIWNTPSYIARAIYWNRKKGEKDCWYWAKVLAK